MSGIVDIHAHVFPDDVATAAMPGMQQDAGVEAAYDGTLAGLRGAMARAGVAVTVTQPVATKPSQTTRINEWAASTAAPDIVPFGSVHPDAEDLPAAVAAVAELGLPGIKLHPEFQAFHPDDRRLDPLYEALAATGLVVLFHAGLDIAVPTEHGTPEAFARLLERHPGLTVVLAHMGGWNRWDGVREHLIGRDVYLDTAYVGGHLPDDEFLSMVEAHGAQRVLFGTDGPWADAADEVRWLRGLDLGDAELSAILGGNARRLLNI